MKLPWRRDPKSDMDVDVLLAQANLTPAPAAAAPAAPAGPFRLVVQDVFRITGRGTVVTGRIESGSVSVGQQVRVTRDGTDLGSTTVTGLEMFRKKVETAGVGENVGLLVSGDVGDGAQSGDVLEN